VAADLGVPFETARGWLRRFAGRAELVRAWLSGLLTRLVDDPRAPAGQDRPWSVPGFMDTGLGCQLTDVPIA
jgi:hypothetical protein